MLDKNECGGGEEGIDEKRRREKQNTKAAKQREQRLIKPQRPELAREDRAQRAKKTG